MKHSHTALAVAFLVCTMLALPAAAAADDQALWDTWAGSHGAQLDTAQHSYERALKRVKRTHYRKPRAVRAAVKANRVIVRLLGETAVDIRAQRSSSDKGARAKALILGSIRAWVKGLKLDRRAIVAYAHRRRARGDRLYDRATIAFARSGRLYDRATELLRDAGVDTG